MMLVTVLIKFIVISYPLDNQRGQLHIIMCLQVNLMSGIFDWVEHPMIAVMSGIKTSFTLFK